MHRDIVMMLYKHIKQKKTVKMLFTPTQGTVFTPIFRLEPCALSMHAGDHDGAADTSVAAWLAAV